MFYSNFSLKCTVFEIFDLKCAVTLKTGSGSVKVIEKKFDDNFSRVDRMDRRDRHTDGQTDGQTDSGRQQRPRLPIASRNKNKSGPIFDTRSR